MTHLRPTWLPLVSSEWIPWRLLRRLRSNNLLRERHRLSLQLLFQDLLLRPPVLEPQDPVEPTPMPVGDKPVDYGPSTNLTHGRLSTAPTGGAHPVVQIDRTGRRSPSENGTLDLRS